jgi:dolichyl-phosphooligosaccharide-protein glycotransferase
VLIGTLIAMYFQDPKFYTKHKRKVDVSLTLVLILIAFVFTIYIRSYAYNLPVADEWAENSIQSNLRGQIVSAIKEKYPNLADEQINNEATKQIEAMIAENPDEYYSEKDKMAQVFREKFQAENGQTYFLAIDPYHYLTLSKNLLINGHKGDLLVDGVPTVPRKIAPEGVQIKGFELHPSLENVFYKMYGLDETSTNGELMKAVYLLPALIAAFAIIPLFFIIKLYSNDLFAFFGSISFSTVTTFLSRTQSGFVDTDAYNVFFPILILCFIVYSLKIKDWKKSSIFAGLAALSQAMFFLAWGNAWFTFLFIGLALISYIAYLLLVEYLKKHTWSQLKERMFSPMVTLVSFFGFAIVFSFMFGKNILGLTMDAILSSSSGIAHATAGNIWPNVLSSVAELNPASFVQIIDSVGGKLVFFFALFGMLLLATDFEKEKKNWLSQFLFYSFSIIWFSLFVLDFKNMGILESLHNGFIGLATNSPLMFLILLMLPVLVGIIWALYEKHGDYKTFLVMLLGIWMAGTIYMSFNGVRFVVLLAPAFAAAFGIGLFYIAKAIKLGIISLSDLFEVKLTKSTIKILTLACIILIVFVHFCISVNETERGIKLTWGGALLTADQIGRSSVPNFDDTWFNLMYKIRDNSSQDAIITSWWDFGHFFISIGERGATFDGASQTTPQSHWVGKLLMENDEEVSHDMLKMLVCGGNNAFDIMMRITNDSTGGVLVNKIIYSTFGVEDKAKVLRENKYFQFSEEEISEILTKLDCDNPPEHYFLTSEDMISKAGVWAHWGSWDFSKKYTLDTYSNKTPIEIATTIDEPVEKIEKWVSQLQEIDLRSKVQNIKRTDLVNQWLAPYPSYMQISSNYFVPCVKTGNNLNCNNLLAVDLEGKNATFLTKQDATLANVIFATDNSFEIVEQDSTGSVDLVVYNAGNDYLVMFAHSPLGGSLFTRAFFLGGAGLKHFEHFDYSVATNGWKLQTWKVKY